MYDKKLLYMSNIISPIDITFPSPLPPLPLPPHSPPPPPTLLPPPPLPSQPHSPPPLICFTIHQLLP